ASDTSSSNIEEEEEERRHSSIHFSWWYVRSPWDKSIANGFSPIRSTPRRGRIDPMRDSARGFELPAHSECDGSGVKFVHAAAKTVSEEVSESLLAVQVTELKDGVFIGYGVNHLICSTGFDLKTFPPLPPCGWFIISSPVEMIFRFTSRHISELKAKANSEVAGSDVDLKISSFQAVLAHMWRSIDILDLNTNM
ncbi:hypothetical protein HID58_007358, partial [Brassica napus]